MMMDVVVAVAIGFAIGYLCGRDAGHESGWTDRHLVQEAYDKERQKETK